MDNFQPRAKIQPNLLVIGAQKAGSTWLHKILDAHPDIFMSKTKELMFFDKKKQTPSSTSDYLENFSESHGHSYRGEATPGYFWTAEARGNAAENAYALLGSNVRLVLSLRDPVDRAVSAFFHHFRQGRINCQATLREQADLGGIVDIGHYQKHYLAWTNIFPKDNFYVTFFDGIRVDGQGIASNLYEWLGLSDFRDSTPEKRPNAGLTKTIKNGKLTLAAAESSPLNKRFFAGQLKADPSQGAPSVTQQDIDWLGDVFEQDIHFVKEHFDSADLDWGPKDLSFYV